MQEFQADLKAPDTTFPPNLHMLICRCHMATEQMAKCNCAVTAWQLSRWQLSRWQLALGSKAVDVEVVTLPSKA
ncbi:hypothetical protein HaLaN_32021, partial [Haematococcus lacustris]